MTSAICAVFLAANIPTTRQKLPRGLWANVIGFGMFYPCDSNDEHINQLTFLGANMQTQSHSKTLDQSISSMTVTDAEAVLHSDIDEAIQKIHGGDMAPTVKGSESAGEGNKGSLFYAIIRSASVATNIYFVTATQKKELSHELANLPDGSTILYVFKGRQLRIKEKKAFNFV